MHSRILFPLLTGLVFSSGGLWRLHAQDPNEKAARLLEPLTKRPGSGPLFERFVNAWLDTGTLDSLGRFLNARASMDPSAANRLLLALFHSRQGEAVKALEQFRAALLTNPGSAEIWYQKALLESRTLDFDGAIASLINCLEAKPAGDLALQAPQLLGRLYARTGKTGEALKVWRALMEARPEDELLREDVLELQIGESLWPAAQETAANLVEVTRDPYRRVLRRMRLGDVYDRSGLRDRALETFASCLEDTGAGSWLEREILHQIDRLFRREDDLSGLKECYQRLAGRHGHRAGLQRALARLLMETGEPEAAIACGRALLELSPGDRTAREEFIALLAGAGRAAEAIPQVEQLLGQTPADMELRLSLAELKYAAKDRAGALAELHACEKLAGAGEGTALRLAGIMDRYGMANEAAATLRAALEKRPDDTGMRLMLASLLHRQDRKPEALAEWQRAAAAGSLPVVQQTARAMQAHGENGAAWQLMTAAAGKGADDAVFLTQLCAMADTAERAAEILTPARRLVEMAKTPSELNSALDGFLRLIRLTGSAAAFTEELGRSAATPQALCLLATLREAARDTIGAGEAIEKARMLSPELALAQLVRLWTVRGDFARAAEAGENLFKSQGGRQGPVAEQVASLHWRAGNAAAALQWTREWKKLMPGATAPVLSEARLLEAAGLEEEALASLRAAAGGFENNSDIRARLAAMSLGSGRTADALRLYSSLYEDAPDLAAKMRWLQPWGQAAQAAGKLDDLITQFEDRKRENRDSAAPLLALAELYRVSDDYEGRRRALTEAARLKPDDPEIALEIARLEVREDNDEAAMQTLRPVLTKDPSGRAAALLSEILLRSGREEEGLQLLNAGATATPASVETTALALARRGDEKAALSFLQPHLLTWPADWRLGFLAALLESRNDQTEAAAARLLALTGGALPLSRPGAVAAPVTAGMQTYEEMVAAIMPPGVQGFFRLILASPGLGQSGGRQPVFNSLPGDPAELKDRAAALLLEMARSAPPEKRLEWTGELERRGFSAAALVPELPPLRRFIISDRNEGISKLMLSHPDSQELLVLAGLNSAYRHWQEPADAVLAEKIWTVFGKTYPLAAVYLALPGAGLQEKTAPWEQEVLAAAEAMEKAPPLLLLAVVRSLGLTTEDDQWAKQSRMDPEWRRRLFAVLHRWQQAADAAGAPQGFAADLREYVFAGLASQYTASNNAKALAGLLDEEWRWQSSRTQVPPGSSGDGGIARPAGFPPDFLPGLDEALLRIVQRTLTPETASRILPFLGEPVLRLLVAARIPGPAAGEALALLQQQQSGSAVPFILAAAWAEKNGDYARASENAVKALYLPVSQEVRRRLDSALVWWASRKGRPGDALFNAGREAALRLRRDAVPEERRSELAALMDTLGLTAEADRLMRQGNADTTLTAGTPVERAEKLLLDGKQKEALPLLAAELRGWARLRVSSGTQMPDRETLAEWRTLVQVHGLMPGVMAAMQPGGAAAQQLAEFAAACEMTGDQRQARVFYTRAMEAGMQKKVPLLLFRLTVQEDPDRAVELFKAMPDAWTDATLRLCLSMAMDTDGRRVSLSDQLKFGAFLRRLIEAMPESAGGEFPVRVALTTFGGEAAGEDFFTVSEVSEGSRLTPLTALPVPEEERARAVRLAGERTALFEGLCRLLLPLPGCGLRAWQHLREVWTVENRDPAALVDDGIAALTAELQRPASKRKQGSQDENNDIHNGLSLLMADAARAGRTADFARLVVPAVRAAKSPLAAARLLVRWPLYEAPEDQFSGAGRAYLRANGASAWEDLAEAAMQRHAGAELADDYLAALTGGQNREASAAAEQFGNWCQVMSALKGPAAAGEWCLHALSAVAGPAKDRAARFAGVPQLRDLIQQMLAGVHAVEGWTGPALRWVRDELIPFSSPEFRAEIESGFSDSAVSSPLNLALSRDDPASARALLDSVPLTEDLDAFYGGGMMLLDAALTLKDQSADRMESLGFGGDPGKLTFGRQLMLGVASDWVTGLCRQLAPWQGRIEALPEPRRGMVLAQLRMVPGALSPSAPPEARSFYQWLFRETLVKDKAELDTNVEAFFRNAADGSIADEEELARQINELLPVMAEARDPRGRSVIAAACRAARSFGEHHAGSLVVEALVEFLSDYRDRPAPATSAWLTGLIMEALRGGMPPGDIYDWELGNGGRSVMNGGDDSTAGSLSRLTGLLGPELHPGDARLLALWFLSDPGTVRADPQVYREGLDWVKGEGARSPHSELVRELEMALLLLQSTGTESEGVPPGNAAMLPAEQEHYLAMLRDESLPLMLRLAMGVSLSRTIASPPLTHAAGQLLHAALSARLPVPQEQEAGVFTALAEIPEAQRDAALIKSLLPLTTLPLLREEAEGGTLINGLTALLGFSLAAGDDSTAGRLLALKGHFPNTLALAVLARQGAKDRITVLLSENPGVLGETTQPFKALGTFDAKLQAALPSVLDGIADPVVRFEALAALTALPSPDSPDPGISPLTQRVEALAAHFSAVPWRSPEARDRVLFRSFLLEDTPLPSSLLPALEDSLNRVPLEALPFLSSPVRERSTVMHGARLRRSAANGDTSPITAALAALASHPLVDDDVMEEIRESLRLAACSALLDGWPQLSDEARAAACAAWRGLIADPACRQWPKEWVRHAQFCQFIHGLAGRNGELRSWFNALSEIERARLHSRLADQVPDTLIELSGQVLEKMAGTAEEKAARRASVFTALVASPMGGSPGYAADRLYLSLPSATPDEFLKQEEALCRARPDDKWLILAFVRTHAAAEAWPAVLARTSAALSAEKPARGSAWAPLMEWQTLALEKSGRPPAAREILEACARLPASGGDTEGHRISEAAMARLIQRLQPN